jgi:hypothetical protein
MSAVSESEGQLGYKIAHYALQIRIGYTITLVEFLFVPPVNKEESFVF